MKEGFRLLLIEDAGVAASLGQGLSEEDYAVEVFSTNINRF
jgi:hypothetical protein